MSKTTTLHVHHTFFSSLWYEHEVKMPYFMFWGRQKKWNFFLAFSFWTWMWFLRIQLQESLAMFDKVTELVVMESEKIH